MSKIKNIDCVFFDVGYTLVNEDEAHKNRIKYIVNELKCNGINITEDIFYNDIIGLAKEYKSTYINAIKKYNYTKLVPSPTEFEILYEDVLDCLKILKTKYKLGIIANQGIGLAERLEKYGVLKYIDVCMSSAEFGISKPNLLIFKKALEKINCDANRSIMVGDRLDMDIAPANKIGMISILIKRGFFALNQTPISNEYAPKYTINNLSELINLLS